MTLGHPKPFSGQHKGMKMLGYNKINCYLCNDQRRQTTESESAAKHTTGANWNVHLQWFFLFPQMGLNASKFGEKMY
jgi:hypothetical protein